MTGLHFPNASRSLDKKNNRICFWGYHKTNDICFFVGIDVLQRLSKKAVIAEPEMLEVFDGELQRVHKAAARVFANGSRGNGMFVYDLTAEDF